MTWNNIKRKCRIYCQSHNIKSCYFINLIICFSPWYEFQYISHCNCQIEITNHNNYFQNNSKTIQPAKASIVLRHWQLQYIPRNMHTVFALLCFFVVIHWLIFPYPSGLLHWHCGNLTIAPVPAKQPWWIWINTSCEFIMNDRITTTKRSTTKPCAYFLG